MKAPLFCLFAFIATSSNAQQTIIPDPNFEQALIDLNLDTGEVDGSVPTMNIASLDTLMIGDYWITDLTGIEDFSGLVFFSCGEVVDLVRTGLDQMYVSVVDVF